MFKNRRQRNDTLHLNLKNVYIFANRQGVLFLLLLLITFVAGVNYGNNLVLGVFFYLVSVWLVALFVTFLQILQLSVSLQSVSVVQVGGLAWVTLKITHKNHKQSHQIELFFDDKDSQQAKTLLSPTELELYERHKKQLLAVAHNDEIRLPVIATQRGANVLPRLTVRSCYPLGVAQAWTYGYLASAAWAYPAPKPFLVDELMDVHSNSAGQVSFAGTDEFDLLAPYVAGDSLAKVSWAHVARGMGMMSKKFADLRGHSLLIDYHAMPSTHHEDRLANISHAVLSMPAHTTFGIKLPKAGVLQGSGMAFIESCLLALAKEP